MNKGEKPREASGKDRLRAGKFLFPARLCHFFQSPSV